MEGRARATESLALSAQLLCREVRVLLHVRASLLGQCLILTQDARRLRRHQLQVLTKQARAPVQEYADFAAQKLGTQR